MGWPVGRSRKRALVKKIAIVGTHPATRDNAPWDDDAWEIWVFNEAPMSDWVKRWEVAFQLHMPEVYTSEHNFVNPRHWAWLQELHPGHVIYMQQRDKRVPASVAYPLDRVLATVAHRRYLTSSAAYAMALALHLGADEIGVWGIELSSNTEYTYQLPCWNYWVGVADGRGVKLGLHCGQMHFSAPLYGYEGAVSLPVSLFEQHIDEEEQVFDIAKSDYESVVKHLRQAVLDRKLSAIPELVRDIQQAGIALGAADASLGEMREYAKRTDIIPRQEFERRAAQARQDGEVRKANMYTAAGFAECLYNQYVQTEDVRIRDALLVALERVGNAAYQTGLAEGSKITNLEYMERLGNAIVAAGGRRTLEKLGMEV